MAKKRRMDEQDIRSCDFQHLKTMVLRTGQEIDVFTPKDRTDLNFEIRVAMRPMGSVSKPQSLEYVGITLHNTDGSGRGIVVVDENDRPMDSEMSEVLAYEMIEYLDIAMSYVYGREPAKAANNILARTGFEIIVQHAPEQDESLTL